MNRFQHWLYRVQHRVAITRREALALLTVLGLLLAGMVLATFSVSRVPSPRNSTPIRPGSLQRIPSPWKI